MKLSNIIPVEQQLAEAIDRLARVCVDLNLDLLPGDLLEEDLLEEGLLEENFLGDCFAMLKSIGKGISGSWQGFVDQVKNSKAPTADFLKGLARGTGLAQLTALAKKSGKSVAEVLKEIAKAAAAQGGGHHGGYGRGYGRKGTTGDSNDPVNKKRIIDITDRVEEITNLLTHELFPALAELDKQVCLNAIDFLINALTTLRATVVRPPPPPTP